MTVSAKRAVFERMKTFCSLVQEPAADVSSLYNSFLVPIGSAHRVATTRRSSSSPSNGPETREWYVMINSTNCSLRTPYLNSI